MRISFKKAAVVFGAATLLCSAGSMMPAYASPGQTVTSAAQMLATNSGANVADTLVKQLIGDSTEYSGVKFTGKTSAIGTFSGFTNLGIPSGVVLSTGLVSDQPDPDDSNWDLVEGMINTLDTASAVPGPNKADKTSYSYETSSGPSAGDADLDKIFADAKVVDSKGNAITTQDAISLEFDFVATGNMVQFTYIFASDEYEEYVGQRFNDIFALLVNGENCALTAGGDVVSINNVNKSKNSSEYVSNPVGSNNVDTGFDGMTVPMTCRAEVNQGKTNHIKFVVADAADPLVDSGVFIKEGSFITDIPDAIDDSLEAAAGKASTLDVLGNDTGSKLVLTAIVDKPTNGTAAIQDNKVVYTPKANFSGTDTFTYTITGVAQATDTAVANVTILPSAVDDAVTTAMKTAVEVKVLDNDSGTGLYVSSADTPKNGTVQVNSPAAPSASASPSASTSPSASAAPATVKGTSITYTPKDGFNGTDTFTYTITDANGKSAKATVTVTVPAPAAKSISVTTGGTIGGSAPSTLLLVVMVLAIIAGITAGIFAVKARR